MSKNVLGRGVGALFQELEQGEESRYFMCDVDKILPNSQQPRSYFDPEKMEQLADSIRKKGVLQPLLVTRNQEKRETPYKLIAGERRLRAAKMAGCEEVPVLIMEDVPAGEVLELALIENIQRQNLNPIEEAKAYHRLIEEFHCKQEEVAQKVGRSRTTITNALRLLLLPESVQNAVITGLISEGHARVLLRLKNQPDLLQEMLERIMAESLSVRVTERLCAKIEDVGAASATTKKKVETEPASPQEPRSQESREGSLSTSYCSALTTQLTNHFNTKVRIVQQGGRGKVEIEYYSGDDLDRLLSLLC